TGFSNDRQSAAHAALHRSDWGPAGTVKWLLCQSIASTSLHRNIGYVRDCAWLGSDIVSRHTYFRPSSRLHLDWPGDTIQHYPSSNDYSVGRLCPGVFYCALHSFWPVHLCHWEQRRSGSTIRD